MGLPRKEHFLFSVLKRKTDVWGIEIAGRKMKMELTKLEKAMIISTFITALGREELEICTDEHSLEQLEEALEAVLYEST